MTQHTPGPWRYRQDGTVIAIEARYGRDGHDPDAWVGTQRVAAVSMYAEADARLIAAAPDLLELAESSLELLENTWVGGPCDSDCECILHDLRAAIAKVCGEAVPMA